MFALRSLRHVPVRLRMAGWWSWLATAVVFGAAGGRRGRRAALRGLLAIVGSQAVIRALVPIRASGGTSAVPSAEAATAAAFVTAAALESAPWTAAASAVGLATTWDLPQRQRPQSIALGTAIGVTAAVGSLRWWPRIDTSPAEAIEAPERYAGEVGPDGEGLTVAVNPGAGGGSEVDAHIEEIRQGLPAADIVEIGEDDDFDEVLSEAAGRSKALGMLGGDGSLNTATEIALDHGVSLVVFPGGTLNHFARDLGVDTIAKAIEAVVEGTVVEVDTASIAGRPFLNTASLGSYSELVMAREKLEDRIGKWPAMLVAMVKVLRHSTPTKILLDGEPRRVWMIFFGNGAYDPPGFAPATRDRLDDGLIDMRLVDGTTPGARLRLVLALATGTLGRSRIYRRQLVHQLEVCSNEEHPMLAADGEVFEGPDEFVVTKRPRSLRVYAPSR